MLSILLYCPSATVLVPTQVQTDLGLYLERGPVESAPLEDRSSVLSILQKVWSRGIARVPHPTDFPPTGDTPSMKAVRARSWAQFVRDARYWTIEETQDGHYLIQGWLSPPRKSHFEPNSEDVSRFSQVVGIDNVFERLISQIQQAAREF